MCGRYTNTKAPEELDEHFGVPIRASQGTRRFNIAPTEEVLAIIAPHGQPRAELMRWGLVPHWANTLKGAQKMINARTESVTRSPAYRNLIGRGARRALQIADGYFEWLKAEQRTQTPQPFLFQVDGGQPFAFAALWTPAKIAGEWVHSLAMLTCDAAPNRVARQIHDRMPVILADRDAQRAWLDPEVNAEEALELCHAIDEHRLSATPANPALNNVNVPEGPELLSAPPARHPSGL
jgi:putative SOS response-associated peptidase YedK